MSQFTTPAVLEMLDSYKWRLVEPFEYYTEVLDFTDSTFFKQVMISSYCYKLVCDIRVPAGYVTDLTTVPRILWSILPPNGRYAKASIVHDYLYSNAISTKLWADSVFLEAMTVLQVPVWRRFIMYLAVRMFGRGAYSN